MNKQIIFLTSFILCSLTTHNNFGMKTQEKDVLIMGKIGSTYVPVKYNINDGTCTLDDIKDAVSKEFQLEPNTFYILFAGRRLPENTPFSINELHAYGLHLVIKK